jgi:hypothetical protein
MLEKFVEFSEKPEGAVKQLKETIEKSTPNGTVIKLISHSFTLLDENEKSRYMASALVVFG